MWLATRAGAAALAQGDEAGGLESGMSAEHAMGALFALAREAEVAAVWIRGRLAFERSMLQAK